jgi:hypothetical protein
MVEASVQMCICEIIVGVVLATQMDAHTGALSRAATIGLIVVVSVLACLSSWTSCLLLLGKAVQLSASRSRTVGTENPV